jgi:metal-responsive CopG/Arc/MetJ family transcriptional regulator
MTSPKEPGIVSTTVNLFRDQLEHIDALKDKRRDTSRSVTVRRLIEKALAEYQGDLE